MPSGSDPIDRLRAADPTQAEDVPSASLARVSARVQEHIVTDVQHPSRTFMSNPLAKLGGVALAGAFALAIAIGAGFNLGGQAPDPVGGNPAAGGGVASCLAYDTATLPTFDKVFDGTVTAVDGDRITFDVNTGWKGVDGSVTLTAPEVNVALTGPMPDFEVGGRYLVTASDSTINACGYTLDHDAETAREWAKAFAA